MYMSLFDTYNLIVGFFICLSELCSLLSSPIWPWDREVLVMQVVRLFALVDCLVKVAG